ncbi:protein translocase subunit SecF [Mechercharimyces sp. CAU 1602]|uniref:protein translocase subunit SecF n=1 Tax=Mechercharimyces sp. CAU 1602 TaxID=2973933 RepID=UPI0037CB6841
MNYKTVDFVGKKKLFFLISLAILLVSIGSLAMQGLNLGIEFTSGTRLDLTLEKDFDLEKANKELETLGYEKPDTRIAGNDNDIFVFRTGEALGNEDVEEIHQHFKDVYGNDVGKQEQKVTPIIGQELAKNALLAVLIASVGIILYVTIRFEYRFAVAAVLALFHDALFVIGMFSIFRWEVDLVFIAAVLTIVGYSVNDTIVIFDRIRENLSMTKPKSWDDLAGVVNESLQQTLVRSFNTVLTVAFAAAALFLFGGESIRTFSLALLLGLLSGTYSSIFIASQVWVSWKWRSMKKEQLKTQTAE